MMSKGTPMKTDSIAKRRSDRTWMTAESCELDDFVKLIARETSLSDYPLASAIQSNVSLSGRCGAGGGEGS